MPIEAALKSRKCYKKKQYFQNSLLLKSSIAQRQTYFVGRHLQNHFFVSLYNEPFLYRFFSDITTSAFIQKYNVLS